MRVCRKVVNKTLEKKINYYKKLLLSSKPSALRLFHTSRSNCLDFKGRASRFFLEMWNKITGLVNVIKFEENYNC